MTDELKALLTRLAEADTNDDEEFWVRLTSVEVATAARLLDQA